MNHEVNTFMVGWFYINEEVAAPVRMLESDEQSGMLSIELAARFIPNLTRLRGTTIVEYRHWGERRAVRCLGAERVGSALLIEAVDVGPATAKPDPTMHQPGGPEDWLTIEDRAFCRITDLQAGAPPRGHCMFRVALNDWRDLRIGENAPLASIGLTLGAGPAVDGSITPLLHAARDMPDAIIAPCVEIVRLRERSRLRITPIATDWSDTTTLVVARINDVASLSRRVQQEALSAP